MGVILMTGYSEVNTAVEAVRLGADVFLKKPFDLGELLLRIEELMKKRQLKKEHHTLKNKVIADGHSELLMGQCASIRKIRETATL